MLVEVSPQEAKALEKYRAKELAVADAKAGFGITGDVLRREGAFTVTRYIGGRHPQYAVYNGQVMLCLCVYRRGAFALLDYLKAAARSAEV